MKRKILIVDDDEEICEELSEILAREGYACETAFDGIKAATLVGKSDYHLVVLDLKLPGLSGFDILRLIKHRRPESRVLVITARPLLKKAMWERGSVNRLEEETLMIADAIINKPFDVEDLLTKIKDLSR